MIVTDENAIILRVNYAFTDITGYNPEEVIGKNPSMFDSGRQDASSYAELWKKLKTTGAWEGEVWSRRKNNQFYPTYLTVSAVKDRNSIITHYVVTFSDITLRKTAEEEIKSLAFYDPLTKLPNRRLLHDRIHQALASSTRTGLLGALLLIDLDNFKALNDTLGHDIGDLLLQQVAQRILACVREGDTVARLGGDEFVVMLENLSKHALEATEQTEAIGKKILSTLNRPYLLKAHEYYNTPSIGAALFKDQREVLDNLFKQADIAMYQAKKAGRNRLRFFDQAMQDSINARAALEGELRKAIERQEFQLYYQIQVDDAGQLLGAETLIRWVHHVHGIILPTEFIPLAEETGLILSIGQWALETACAQLKAWKKILSPVDLRCL
jgi:diguanylate cyclase (GGDEF)-like protein/PAS domain S-box-containing protein